MRILPLAEERGFLYAHPDGIQDALGLQFWNATDVCCDLFNTGVDDETILFGGGSGEIWAIRGGSHVPVLSGNFSGEVIDYLMSHPKPE